MPGVNFLGLIAAPPEHGKSSIAVDLGATWLREGCNLFVVDPNRQFRRMVRYYESVADWRRAAMEAARKNKPLARGAGFATDEGLTELLIALGKKCNTVDHARFPMAYICDESTAKTESGSTHISKSDDYMISNRRHLGIKLLLNLQRTSMLMTAWWEISTDVFVFRQSMKRLRKLGDELDLQPCCLRKLYAAAALPPHHYIHIQPGRGVIPCHAGSPSRISRSSSIPSQRSAASSPTTPTPGSRTTTSDGRSKGASETSWSTR